LEVCIIFIQFSRVKEEKLRRKIFGASFFLCFFGFCLFFFVFPIHGEKKVGEKENGWTSTFHLQDCHFAASGKNRFFILEPGYRLVLEDRSGKNTGKLIITVLGETKTIAGIVTRIVEERETSSGKLVEVSRNFFAICTETNSVFYFGEEVDIYKKGKIVGHEGTWQADGTAKAGLMMPGLILLGARYYQEIAPGVAMDRVEIVAVNETIKTPAGTFSNCLKIKETTPLEKGAREYKFYAPGIGLVKDGKLLLTDHGYIDNSKK
jgi:hypothetical protein